MQETLIRMPLIINGLLINTFFYQDNIDTIFIPLLRKLTAMQRQKNRRLIVFIAAAPGTGKSALAAYLENLSAQIKDAEPVQAAGIDGFHHTNRYLEEHHINNDLTQPLLKTVKGAPDSFDTDKLTCYLRRLREENIIWPVYSRVSHDVDDNGILLNKKIILLEGNYLLLDKEPWKGLRDYAGYTIFLKADPGLLKQRLIDRKHAGGFALSEAAAHYMHTDAPNVSVVNGHSARADLTLTLDAEMKYYIAH